MQMDRQISRQYLIDKIRQKYDGNSRSITYYRTKHTRAGGTPEEFKELFREATGAEKIVDPPIVKMFYKLLLYGATKKKLDAEEIGRIMKHVRNEGCE